VQLLPALAKFSEGLAMVMRKARGMICSVTVRNAFRSSKQAQLTLNSVSIDC
jgi:hypothetical protein